MDKTRTADLKIIESGLKNPDPTIRNEAFVAGQRIKKQMSDKHITRMREKMVHETRRGRNDNANDIREDIQNHERRGYGNSSFTFSISEDRYNEIFKK